MWTLRCVRDEAVQDDGDCRLKHETFEIVSQLRIKNKAGRRETACPSSVLGEVRPVSRGGGALGVGLFSKSESRRDIICRRIARHPKGLTDGLPQADLSV